MKGRARKSAGRRNARWHRDPVLRCDCGRLESDGLVDSPEGRCAYGYCTQVCCPGCGRIRMGMGPLGCLCDSRGGGHQRPAEQPRPGLRKKYRDRRPRARHLWEREVRLP